MPSDSRIVEAYIGEYASGKSELAINRALELRRTFEPVILVDLDFVEPFYTLRPVKKLLEQQGLTVVAWEREDTFGLGETGNLVHPAARWVMGRPGHIILDVGYGVHGAGSLNLAEGALESPELKVWVVINIARPVTAEVSDIVDYVKELQRVDGLINNTHLGDNTTIDFVCQGLRVVEEAGRILNLPVIYTALTEELAVEAGLEGAKVKIIKRYMPEAMW
ncbi:MAG: hypothetical protein GXY50_00335 [Syntrophomonadaceae bacterium]|nr:hypothetical protein [Syntrophomonadaceae bacterium]